MMIKRISKDIYSYGDIEEKVSDINWKILNIEDGHDLKDEWIEELNRKNEKIEEMLHKYVDLGRKRIVVHDILVKAFLKVEEYIEEELVRKEQYQDFVKMYESVAENKIRKEEKTNKIKIE